MRAWIVDRPGPMRTRPLRLVERVVPQPGSGEVRVRVAVCGICRTDLHLAEGDLPVHRPTTVPAHEIVGLVDAVGERARRFQIGDRVGIAWLRHTCGQCRFCQRGDENLCVAPRFTGWDADGGLAEYAVVDERYAYVIPPAFDDEHAAPLLCAGIIGFRALRRANLPPGGRLGIYGFGASAHLAAQVALFEGATVHVLTRSSQTRRHALELVLRLLVRPTTRRRSRSTQPSCSPRRESWCRSRLPLWTVAARWRSLASTSATSRRCGRQ
jgi:alcohol dehydrogenase, propanol-preferring